MNGRPVSKRYRQFAPEYVSRGFNGTQTVLNLGWTNNQASAAVIAHRLLRNVKTRQLIEKHIMDAKISADEVLEELSTIARTPIPQEKFSENAKLKALELAGKAHKLFVDKIEQQSVADPSSVRISLLRRISKISAKTGDSAEIVERELQSELADKSDEDYSPELDARLHPELWPSGNLLTQNELAPLEGGEQ